MGTDKVQLAKEGIEAFNNGDWERFTAPLSSDAVYEELATQRKVKGPDQIVEASKGWKEAFPDAKGTITKVTEGPDTVVLEITWQGTHTELLAKSGLYHRLYTRKFVDESAAPPAEPPELILSGTGIRTRRFGPPNP